MLKKFKSLPKFNLTNNEYFLIIGLWSFVLGFLVFSFLGPISYEGKSPRVFVVNQGDSFSTVVKNLCKEKIISNSTTINIAAFLYSADTKVKAGQYSIPKRFNYFELIELFLKGVPAVQVKVTIPEGIWQHNLAKILEEKLGLNSKKILHLSTNKSFLNSLNIVADNLEGYLLPNTYYFYETSDEVDVITKLKSEMDKIFENEDVIQQMSKLNMNKNEILTLASIIDGETNLDSEVKLISGVYHNRLKKGMLLQADPTVQYLKRHQRSKNKVYFRDLEIDSPYNTYKYRGLPPSPINNPGKNAVMAAIFPEETDYIFFVADGTGGHKFAKNLSEHNANVQHYRNWRSSQ